MNKAELYARYWLHREEIVSIDRDEFLLELNNAASKDDSAYKFYSADTSTEMCIVETDGMTYYQFSSLYNVGWQGDVDCDQFYCKVGKCTKAEMEEIRRMFAPQEIHEQFD